MLEVMKLCGLIMFKLVTFMQYLIVGAIIGNLIYMRSLQEVPNTVQDQLLCPKHQVIKQNKFNLRYVLYIRT